MISIGVDDPEFYAEVLCKTSRPANRRHLSDEQSCPEIPGIDEVDGPLAHRLQIILDSVADISLSKRRNVSATVANLEVHHGTLETRLFIVFNHQDNEAAWRCPQHLQDAFNILRKVPYQQPGSPKVIAEELHENLIEFCTAIHNYSFDVFAYRVTKRADRLLDLQRYIQTDRQHFESQNRSTLLTFLREVEVIIKGVTKAQTTKRLSTAFIRLLLIFYSKWTENKLLPKAPNENDTLLDDADSWLAEEHKIGFRLRRWALKIMSFLLSANRLFSLTQSHRLRKIIQGKLFISVLASPTTAPYRCDLSTESLRLALDASLAGTSYLSAKWNKKRKSFIKRLQKDLKSSEVVCRKPTVHAELAIIMAMVKGEIQDVLPYIGVSKLSCIMCSYYIHAFNESTEKKVATRGSHGKAYPGWFWPNLPDRDGELRPAFLEQIRQQHLRDFEQNVKPKQLSDSSVEPGGPGLEIHLVQSRIEYLMGMLV